MDADADLEPEDLESLAGDAIEKLSSIWDMLRQSLDAAEQLQGAMKMSMAAALSIIVAYLPISYAGGFFDLVDRSWKILRKILDAELFEETVENVHQMVVRSGLSWEPPAPPETFDISRKYS
jgi:hypothetical protein